jgi:hypothetical protein
VLDVRVVESGINGRLIRGVVSLEGEVASGLTGAEEGATDVGAALVVQRNVWNNNAVDTARTFESKNPPTRTIY